MAGTEDRNMLARLTRVIESTPDPAVVTSNPAFRGALVEARERVMTARAELGDAVGASEQDGVENRTAAVTFDEIAAEAVVEYAALAEDRTHALLALRPRAAAALGGAEVERRQAFVATAFEVTPSDLSKLGRTALFTTLTGVLKRCAGAPDLAPPEVLVDFEASLAKLAPAHAAVVAEALDDAPLSARLATVRLRAQSALSAFRSLLEGLLRFEASPLTVDAFLLRQAPGRSAAPAETPPADTTPETVP